tara:strand:+ start:196 stop:528 length:333 start_codon:yes stop_codon:yes gene_type:complete
MKLKSKYISKDYELNNGSDLNILTTSDTDEVKVTPKSNKQGDCEIKERILNSIEVECSKWKDEVRIDLSKYEIVSKEISHYIDTSDSGVTIITLNRDGRHKLTIKLVNNV